MRYFWPICIVWNFGLTEQCGLSTLVQLRVVVHTTYVSYVSASSISMQECVRWYFNELVVIFGQSGVPVHLDQDCWLVFIGLDCLYATFPFATLFFHVLVL